MGIVKAIDHQARTISLHHQPIAALQMPAMHMELPVASDVNLDEIQSGDHIQFILVQQTDNLYLITKVQHNRI